MDGIWSSSTLDSLIGRLEEYLEPQAQSSGFLCKQAARLSV